MEPLFPQPQLPPPLPVPELLAGIIQVINDFQRKNTTMINYYITPSPVPTEIAAYEPRLLIYRTRIQNLAKLSLAHLSSLADNGNALVLSYTKPNIEALAAASMSMQRIFIEHYDRRLETSLPYDTIFQTFRHYEQNIHQLIPQLMSNPRLRAAEYSVPPPSSTHPSLCRGATSFLNNRDQGKVSNCAPTDLLPYHRSRLADRSGVVLWWECNVCAFKLRYHASNSSSLSINHTDEIIIEDDIASIAYRPAWLVKCHIYHPRQPQQQNTKPPAPAPSPPTSPRQRYTPDPVSPKSPGNTWTQSAPKRVAFMSRKSFSHTPATIVVETSTTQVRNISPPNRSPHDYFSHATTSRPPQSPRSSRPSSGRSRSPTGPRSLRYFCPFCIAVGRAMHGPTSASSSSSSSSDDNPEPEPTCFESAREFIEHIEDRHTHDIPVNLLLLKLRVGVRGEMAPEAEGAAGHRWDLDLR